MTVRARLLRSVSFFLFKDAACAEPVGTAFSVNCPIRKKPHSAILFVTAKHNLYGLDSIWGRFNVEKPGKKRQTEEFELEVLRDNGALWEHPDRDVDLTVFNTSISAAAQHMPVPLDVIARRETFKEEDIDATDRVVLSYMFVDFLSTEFDYPIVRDGCISLIPDGEVPINYRVGPTVVRSVQEAIIIDAMSIPGSSGCPVFLWPGPRLREGESYSGGKQWLLGIMQGFMSTERETPVSNDQEKPIDSENPVETEHKRLLRENVGLAFVTPSWKLLEILELPELKTHIDASY